MMPSELACWAENFRSRCCCCSLGRTRGAFKRRLGECSTASNGQLRLTDWMRKWPGMNVPNAK
jgi:hypothetical protein